MGPAVKPVFGFTPIATSTCDRVWAKLVWAALAALPTAAVCFERVEDTDDVIDDALERFDRVLSMVGPAQ